MAKAYKGAKVFTRRVTGNYVHTGAIAAAVDAKPVYPAILASFAYLRGFDGRLDQLGYRNWAMDSGAFTAATTGKKVELAAYIATCQRLMATDPTLLDIFSLDVIGDWRAGDRNTMAMWEAGVPAIPTYHPGEPEDYLVHLSKTYPKIAIGGAVGQDASWKDRWVHNVFARVWPCKIHGLGMTGDQMLLRYPFHSVDSSNWDRGPAAWGYYRAFDNKHLRIRSDKTVGGLDLRCEVDQHLKIERDSQARWRATWAAAFPDEPAPGPTLRLALNAVSQRTLRCLPKDAKWLT